MENVFDIKYKQQLEYILPDTVASDMDLQRRRFQKKQQPGDGLMWKLLGSRIEDEILPVC